MSSDLLSEEYTKPPKLCTFLVLSPRDFRSVAWSAKENDESSLKQGALQTL